MHFLVEEALSFSSYFMSSFFEFDFREPVRKTRPCIEDFLNASRRCLKAEDQEGLNIALRMIDSAIEFMCHNSGDRIACKYISTSCKGRGGSTCRGFRYNFFPNLKVSWKFIGSLFFGLMTFWSINFTKIYWLLL